MSVAVVSCLYGDTFSRFAREWAEHIHALDPAADEVIVASDRDRLIPGSKVVVSDCPWRYPQAWYLKEAICFAASDWVWICDIDDRAMPDALKDLDDIDADVWQMGFHRSDGETYLPPPMNGWEFIQSDRNVFTAGSAFRVTAFWRAGGMADVALQDWSLWRRLALSGARFASSSRPHYWYQRHNETRGATELTLDRRPEHLEEMFRAEVHTAAA